MIFTLMYQITQEHLAVSHGGVLKLPNFDKPHRGPASFLMHSILYQKRHSTRKYKHFHAAHLVPFLCLVSKNKLPLYAQASHYTEASEKGIWRNKEGTEAQKCDYIMYTPLSIIRGEQHASACASLRAIIYKMLTF